MTWIETIPYEAAEGRLRSLYDRIKGPDDNVDNIMMAHSLRPHAMAGHLGLYKSVLHHSGNALPRWFMETLGVYVSMLNRCAYCVEHHYHGLRRLLNDDERANRIRQALGAHKFDEEFDEPQMLMLEYAQLLTLQPRDVSETLIHSMRQAGLKDGEILEANQVVAYFAYANRTVLGLGCNTEGDILGLSPNDVEDDANWEHR